MFIQNNERFKMVVKSNEMIQKSRFNLTTNQQKVILYLISKLKYTDEEFTEYQINIRDFCKVCGIDSNGGKAYAELKESIKQIADKSMWIEKEDGAETLVRWIEKPTIYKNEGYITIKLDNDLKPYLLNLKERYTQYELIYTLQMKSKYSIRLYELLKSRQYNKLKSYTVKYSIDELKKILDAQNYTAFKDFRRRVIEKAVEEINNYSDINIEYTAIKSGKAVKEIEIYIETKEIVQRLTTTADIERKLDNGKDNK